MGKVRNSLILLLAIACIGLVAFLPKFTGWVQDTAVLGEVSFAKSVSVELEIQEDMPLLGKLAMLCRMNGVIEVPRELAGMTQEEAEHSALSALEPYIAVGLIPEFEVWSIEAQPLLIQTSEAADLTGIFWSVVISEDQEQQLYVCLDIDDATGKLLRLNFSCEYWDQTDLEACLSRFAQVYFPGLDLEDYEYFATDDLENQHIGDDAVGIRYRFGDMVYGEVNVDLFVYKYGFYVDTPRL